MAQQSKTERAFVAFITEARREAEATPRGHVPLTHGVVEITDATGTVICDLVDADYLAKYRRYGFRTLRLRSGPAIDGTLRRVH